MTPQKDDSDDDVKRKPVAASSNARDPDLAPGSLCTRPPVIEKHDIPGMILSVHAEACM